VSSSTQRNRRREQRENTRREILTAADAFLREHPYRELSLEVVMAQTGLTRTAFYRHFDDVTELVLRLLQDVGQELYDVAERWLENAGEDLPGAAREALSGIVGFFERHGPLVRAVADAAGTDEQIERGYRGFVEAFIVLTTRGFDDLAAAGVIDVVDTRALSRALNLMNESYLLDTFGRDPRGDSGIAFETLSHVWLSALGVDGPAD
jgi:AcrR family transcriptional regulator